MKLLIQQRIILSACLFLLFVLPKKVDGQISQGGIPIHIQKLKSAAAHDLIVLPAVDNEKLQRENQDSQQQSGLKAFRFAHPFDVSLSTANSGQWYSTPEVNVWQLRIRSVGAYSLNVIFGNYRLPENARLFIIGATQEDIKGAYTTFNNSPYNSLAIEPVAGDEMLIQYEEPVKSAFRGELEISRISHDFMGLGTARDRRPLGISGSCNVNINCDQVDGTEDIRDAVCRIIVEGTDVCTGTLVNNTANDGTPYLLTAYHCINSETKANASVFLFNYESPACVSVDGDVSRSMSGSNLRASFDSLDFALVELREDIPFANRPYLAGWNRRNQIPTSSKSIHHPMGDIKKIATDKDAAKTSSYSRDYLVNGAWKILRWDTGVTESGSSGGPLFDQDNLLVGTLTGGSATCSVPTNDFFSKFALAWSYRREQNRQLKTWLDPVNSNAEKINGHDPNIGETLCQPITNFKNADFHDALQIREGGVHKGYYGGTNSAGFTDFAELYKFSESCEIQGVSLGIAKAKTNPLFAESMINVRVYEGENEPVTLLYS
ncbi:MAG: trypsin-like peptidase domain-containing protein, partial [Verrucomicrobia bacterium]|nr:trypsin-like peptidase domain-containing protein [Prolixibacteraceae bacterium]